MAITYDLDEKGHAYNRKTVAGLMKRLGLAAKAGKKYKATTDSEYNFLVAPSRLGQDFSADAPNRMRACDITYVLDWQGLAIPAGGAVSFLAHGGGLGHG